MDNIVDPNSQDQMPAQQTMSQGAPQPMPFIPFVPPKPRTWREKMMRRYGMDKAMQMQFGSARTIPTWIVGKSVVFFFLAMMACWSAFGYVPGMDLWLPASISVVLFFFGGAAMSRNWSGKKGKRFLRNVFIAGFLIRLIWVLYCYFFFNPDHFGNTYGDGADVDWYMPFAEDIAQLIRGDSKHTLSQVIDTNGAAIDDVGYPMWLGIGYAIWGEWSDVFMPFLVKCIIGSYCAICIYHVAKRHFGEGTARLAAIFVCVNPNMIYWCAVMMKEAEMVFLCCLAVDNFDKVLSSGKRYTFKSLLPGMLAGLALMFFRTALGLVIFLAVFAHVVMVSDRVMGRGKKIIAGVLVAAVLAVSMGERIRTQSQELLETAQSSEKHEENLEFRANRQGGNSFAKYAGTAVFAPLIFTIPFPTFNTALEAQLVQVQLGGGSFVKNVLSFFVLLVMIMMLITGEWRRHVFILAYTLGYHVVLVLSSYAHSGRFHMPVWPMLMLFAAYGVQIAKGNARLRRGYTVVLVLEVLACLAWNWFKLKGRGLA